MDVHFVDHDDDGMQVGKRLGMQVEFDEAEGVGMILAFAGFLMHSDDPDRSHLAGTIHTLATILAKARNEGALELEPPKDEPIVGDGPTVEVNIPGRAWEITERNASPSWIEGFDPAVEVSTGGTRAYFGLLAKDELDRLIGVLRATAQAPNIDKNNRSRVYDARRRLEALRAKAFEG